MSADPVFTACAQSFPDRPVIDAAETPWTREQLHDRIDHCMQMLVALTDWELELRHG